MAKVYVSSTIDDLREERQEVFEWLQTARHQVIHSYLPDSETVSESCLADVASSDLLVLLVGHRYGHSENPDEPSITHREFRHAGKLGIPRVALLRMHIPDVKLSDIESPEQLRRVHELRAEARKAVRASEFKQPGELVRFLSAGVEAELQKVRPAASPELGQWLEEQAQDTRQRFANHLVVAHAGGAGRYESNYFDLVITERRMGEREADPNAEEAGRQGAETLEAEVLRAKGPLLLLGEGGAGKSTSILHTALTALDRFEADPTNLLPIHVDLAQLATCATLSDFHQYIADSLPRVSSWHELSELGVLERYRVLFLFDSFNEMPEPVQRSCAAVLLQFVGKHKGRHIVLLGSRLVPQLEALTRQGSPFKTFDILKLKPDQVQAFLKRVGLGALYDKMSDSLRELAGNPFALLAISQALAGTPDDALPRNRGSLYQKFVASWMDREKGKRQLVYAYEQVKEPLLAYVAKRVTAGASTSIERTAELDNAIEAKLKDIHKQGERRRRMPDNWKLDDYVDELLADGLLRRQGGRLQFLHQSVQEYFTSVYFLGADSEALVEFTPALGMPTADYELARVSNHRFVPALLMASGMLADATPLVRSLAERNPVLAAATIAAANTVDAELLGKLQAIWLAGVAAEEPAQHWLACSCLTLAAQKSTVVASALLDATLGTGSSAASAALLALGPQDVVVRLLIERVLAAREFDPMLSRRISELISELESDALVGTLFESWRAEQREPERQCLQRLLGTIDEAVGIEALSRIEREARDQETATAAGRAILELPSWPSFVARPRANLPSEVAKQLPAVMATLSGATNQELADALRSLDVARRTAAAKVAAERRAPLASELLDAIVTFPRATGRSSSLVFALETIAGTQATVTMLAEVVAAGSRLVRMLGSDVLEALERGDMQLPLLAIKEAFGPRFARGRIGEQQCAEGGARYWRVGLTFNPQDEYWLEFRLTPAGLELRNHRPALLAARALADLQSEAALPVLHGFAMGHPNPKVRKLALATLSRSQFGEIVPELLAELASTESVTAASVALSGLKGQQDKAALCLLNDLFSLVDVDHENDEERHPRWGTGSWGSLIHGALSALDADEEIMHSLDAALLGDSSGARLAAVRELGRWLGEDLEPDRLGRWWTAERAATLLGLALSDPLPQLRDEATDALTYHYSEAVEMALRDALLTGAEAERLAAAEVLASAHFKHCHKTVTEELLRLAREPAAKAVLNRIGSVLQRMSGAVEQLYAPILAHLEANRAKQALALIDHAIALVPHEPNLHWWRGHAQKLSGQLERAAESFANALQLIDGPSLVPPVLAGVLIELGDTAGALKVAEDGAEGTPDDADAQAVLALAAFRNGALVRSREAATKAVALDPVHPLAIWLVVLTALHGGTALEARQGLDHALRVWRHLHPDLDDSFLGPFAQELARIGETSPERAQLVAEFRGRLSSEPSLANTVLGRALQS